MDYVGTPSAIVGANKRPAVLESLSSENLIERNRKLKKMTAASQQLCTLRDSHEVVMLTLSHITDLLGIRHAVIWSRDCQSEEASFYCRAASTQRLYNALKKQRIYYGQGIAGWVGEHGKCGFFVGQDRDFLDYSALLNSFQFQSVLAIPLHISGEVAGVVEILSPEAQLDPDDIELVNTLTSSAAIALENVMLVETLRQKTAELETRNEELDAFAHTVAHDLRTPLNWVNGYIELLIKDWDILNDDERSEYAHATHHGAQMMSNIIDELLLMASLHDADVVYTRVNMDMVLESARRRLEPMLRQYAAELVIPQGYPIVSGYGPWIEGVWVNYISNAIKYGGTPPRVEIGHEIVGNFVKFWVEDNGQGLTELQQAQLFTPFSGSGKKQGKGHGLGLSIVRRIVEKLGGTVGVQSGPEKGSCFTFTLPIADYGGD